jgi:O-antigen/teichoic acid export membrane protein
VVSGASFLSVEALWPESNFAMTGDSSPLAPPEAEDKRFEATPARKQSLTFSALWLMAAKALGFALGMAVPFLMARWLDRFAIGQYKQVFQFIATAGAVLPFGFGMTAFYFFPRESQRRPAVCLNILIVCGGVGALAGILLLLYPPLLPQIFGEPTLAHYVPEVAVLVPLWIIAGLLETFPVVHQEFRLATVFIVGSQLSRATLMFSSLAIFGTVKAMILAAVIHSLLQTFTLFWYLEIRQPRFWRAFDWELLVSQIRYAAPLGLAGVLYAFQSDLHDYVVSRRFGTAIFAVYSIGCADLPLIGILLESAASVMIGRVSELQLANNTKEIIAVTARVARKLSAVFFPVYAFLMVTGRELITVMYTAKFLDSWPIFAVNCTILLLIPILLDPICRAYPAMMPLFIRVRVILFIAMIVALWFFVGRFGPVAAIAIVVCRLAVENVFGAIYYGRALGMTRRDLSHFGPMLRIAMCSAVAGGVALALRQMIVASRPIMILIECGVIFSATYIAALFILKVPTPEEKQSASRAILKWAPMLRAR